MTAASRVVPFDLNILEGGFMVVGNNLPEQVAKRTFVFRFWRQSHFGKLFSLPGSTLPLI
jgi:hypothetical protein